MQEGRPSAEIAGLSGTLSETPWSADFVMQSIEVLPVMKRDDRICHFAPEHDDSLILGWPAGKKHDVIAAGAIEHLGLRPLVLHSTSWRHAGPEVILTYICVVDPLAEPPEFWVLTPVVRTELARG